jgi:hypothetical protein
MDLWCRLAVLRDLHRFVRLANFHLQIFRAGSLWFSVALLSTPEYRNKNPMSIYLSLNVEILFLLFSKICAKPIPREPSH